MIDAELIFSPADTIGDTIVASPIARHFAKLCRKLHVPVATWQIPTVSALFSEEQSILVTEYRDSIQLDAYIQEHNLIRLQGPPIFTIPKEDTFSCVLWDEQWYNHYEIPYGQRYLAFNLPEVSQSSRDLYKKLVNNSRYILTHSQWSGQNNVPIDLSTWRTGSGLDSLDQFQIIDLAPSITNNLLDYVELIVNAEEIHCVPSCMFHLVDSITNKTRSRLFIMTYVKMQQCESTTNTITIDGT